MLKSVLKTDIKTLRSGGNYRRIGGFQLRACCCEMKKTLFVLCFTLCSTDPSWSAGWAVQPQDSNIKVVDVNKGVRWQMTKTTLRSFLLLKEAFRDGGLLGVVIGVVGTPVAAAVLVVAPPVDLLTTPLRWKNTFDMEIAGELRNNGVPVANKPIALTAEAWSTNDILPFHVFNSSAAAVTGANGEFSVMIRTSVGANKSFKIFLDYDGGHICKWEVYRRGKRKLEVHKYETRPFQVFGAR